MILKRERKRMRERERENQVKAYYILQETFGLIVMINSSLPLLLCLIAYE
jgi:hypothetical protein